MLDNLEIPEEGKEPELTDQEKIVRDHERAVQEYQRQAEISRLHREKSDADPLPQGLESVEGGSVGSDTPIPNPGEGYYEPPKLPLGETQSEETGGTSIHSTLDVTKANRLWPEREN